MKLTFPNKLNIGRLLDNKKFTATLACILSFSIWLIVMINRNPVRDQVFTDITATVSIENTVASELGLGIISDVASQKFTVTLSGPNYIVSSLKSEDFLLSASVADVNASGTYTLDVLGTMNSTKTGYTFKNISPATIDVTFDYIDVKEFTVAPKLIGVGAAEGLIADTPAVSDANQSTITVKGPRSVMERIATVGAYSEVNKTLGATQSYDCEIVLYDENDKIIYRYTADGKVYDASENLIESTYLTLSFTNVKVTQPISKKAEVRVKPSFTGLPSGIKSEDIKWNIDHSVISVVGTPDIVSSMKELTLPAVDFRGVSPTSNSFEVSATLPDGVKILDSIDFFTVTIDTTGYAEKTFNISEIKCVGLDSSLNAKTSNRIRNVKICGPADVIAQITAADLYAVLDLTDKSAGEHTIEATIKSDKFNNIWQVGAYSTTVTIR